MTENNATVRYSAEELKAMRARGASQSNWEAAAAVDDSDMEDDLPPNFFETAYVIHAKRKKQTTLRLDEDLLEWFRQEAARNHSRGYQTMMHSVLAAYRQEKERGRGNRML